MAYVIIAVILGLIAVAGILAAVFTTLRGAAAAVAAGAVVLLLIITGFSSATTVDARAVGINVAFGKYQRTYGPGLHWTAPWSSTEQFSTRIQKAYYEGDKAVEVTFSQGDRTDPVTNKKVEVTAGGGKGRFSGRLRYQISDELGDTGAKKLWTLYPTFEKVNEDLVGPVFYEALTNAGNNYKAGEAVVSQDKIAKTVLTEVTPLLAEYGIKVNSLSITKVQLDNNTQNAVDKIFATEQDITAASNRKARAAIDAETVRIQNEKGALSPAANQKYCLDVLNSWDAKNGQIPATLNCDFTGGTKTPVIIGQSK
jgi:regulator of protease activity HflC (stomatin/prohibitin superfamily)